MPGYFSHSLKILKTKRKGTVEDTECYVSIEAASDMPVGSEQTFSTSVIPAWREEAGTDPGPVILN